MTRNRPHNTWLAIKPLLDAVFIVLAFALAYLVRYHLQWVSEVEPAYWVPFSVYVPSVALLTGILVAAYWLGGAYREERGRLIFDEFAIVFRGTVTGIATMIVIVPRVAQLLFAADLWLRRGGDAAAPRGQPSHRTLCDRVATASRPRRRSRADHRRG